MASSYAQTLVATGQFINRVNRNGENLEITGLEALKDETVFYLQLVREKIVESFELEKLIATQHLSKEQIKGVSVLIKVAASKYFPLDEMTEKIELKRVQVF